MFFNAIASPRCGREYESLLLRADIIKLCEGDMDRTYVFTAFIDMDQSELIEDLYQEHNRAEKWMEVNMEYIRYQTLYLASERATKQAIKWMSEKGYLTVGEELLDGRRRYLLNVDTINKELDAMPEQPMLAKYQEAACGR
jgi:hypothetical protein